MSHKPPVVIDDENPEWTAEDFAKAKRGDDIPAHIREAFAGAKAKRGRPAGSIRSEKQLVSVRLDRDALERLKAQGPGWQSRINEAVRKAAGL